jgi:hypothetical protein
MFSSASGDFRNAGARLRRRAAALLVTVVTAVLGAGLLDACGNSDDRSRIGARKWGTVDVAVEVRPSPPRPGHNEVVVIVSAEHHRPVYDAIVALRVQPAEPWVQAIEDGHVGVYRRAVVFGPGRAAVLQVRLQRAGEQAVLEFPVAMETDH